MCSLCEDWEDNDYESGYENGYTAGTWDVAYALKQILESTTDTPVLRQMQLEELVKKNI